MIVVELAGNYGDNCITFCNFSEHEKTFLKLPRKDVDSIICTLSSFIKEKKNFCKKGIVTEKISLYSSYGQDSTASILSTP